MTDDYSELEDDLTAQILLNARLRDAQVADSEYHQHFQARITAVTRQRHALQAALPELQVLEVRVAQAARDLRLAEDDLAHAPVARMVRGGLVAAAGVGCLVLAAAGWGIAGLVAGLALAGSGSLVVWRTATRRGTALDERDSAVSRMGDAETERDTLHSRIKHGNGSESRSTSGTVPLDRDGTGVFADAARQAGVPQE